MSLYIYEDIIFYIFYRMVYLEITRNNVKQHIEQINKQLAKKDGKLFVLIYMEGCGPCNETRPEWSKLKNVLSKELLDDDDIMVVAIDKDVVGEFDKIAEPNSFPTIRYITNAGKSAETYEDSEIETKDRSVDSFVDWIQHKTKRQNVAKADAMAEEQGGGRKRRSRRHRYTRVTKKAKRGGRKWSAKYKRSINCRRPRGFSQKQYCKYSRRR